MSGTEHKKSRPLYVANYLKQKSDSDHWVTQKEILAYLYQEYEIMPDRKTIKRDIAMLRDEMGMDIEEEAYKGYRLLSREFELDDLKILAECVYAAKFISEERSKDLIDVLCDFCSENQAKRLKREIYLCDRIKTSENKTLRTINTIREAMEPQRWPSEFQRGRKITFRYMTHSITDVHKLIDKHDGKLYTVSPYQLVINDGNYYLIGMPDDVEALRTYRIDRMRDVSILDEHRNMRKEWSTRRDMKTYIRQTFSMFGGEQEKVTIRFANSLLDTVIDKFGVGFGAEYIPDGENHFVVTTNVSVSDQFYAWVCGFGTKAKIVAPEDLAKKYKAYLCCISSMY
jgi:predicted DNA-binding transcriptional regulator YafY